VSRPDDGGGSERSDEPRADGAGARGDPAAEPFGQAWVYESIVGALPGIRLSTRAAVGLQVLVFETAVLALGAFYGLWNAAVAGTAAVVVAAAGSVTMHRLGDGYRRLGAPRSYYRLLFGSNIEVVLAVLAFIALVVHLFVFDAGSGGLVERLFGPDPPVLVVYLTLLVLWDLCYRIGASWWAAVVSLWRALRVDLDPTACRLARRLDATNVAFAASQVVLLPFVRSEPVLFAAVGGHILAVGVFAGAAILLTGD